jgi:hypothetical protein
MAVGITASIRMVGTVPAGIGAVMRTAAGLAGAVRGAGTVGITAVRAAQCVTAPWDILVVVIITTEDRASPPSDWSQATTRSSGSRPAAGGDDDVAIVEGAGRQAGITAC